MRKERIVAIGVILILGVNLVGCNIKSEEKKIVLEEDVARVESSMNDLNKIDSSERIEILNLSLKEDEYFMTMFYEGSEIY